MNGHAEGVVSGFDRSGTRRTRLLLGLLLVALTGLRLWYIQSIPLSEDEANSWQWARHPALGYFDHGPMVAWMVRLGTLVLGNTVPGVRLTVVFLSLGLSLLVYDFCRRVFKDERLGLGMVLAFNSSVLVTAGALIQTYDTSQAFFWMLALYCVGLAVFDGRTWAWYAAGAATGLGMLAKYSSVLLPLLVLVFLLTTRRHRRWLRSPHPWLGGLTALGLFSPNIWWNATHHWAAFGHTAGLAARKWEFTTHRFLGAQWLLIGPVLAVLLLAGLGKAWGAARRGDDRQALLLWLSVPVLSLFLLMSVRSHVEDNWPAPAYLGAMLAAGAALRETLRISRRWRRWTVVGLGSGYLLVGLTLAHVPVLKLLDVPAERDPTARLYGWPQLGAAIGTTLDTWPGAEKPFVFGLRYQTASIAAFYTPGQPQTEGLFLPGERLNVYVFWTDPCRLKGHEGLGVVTDGSDLGSLFEQVQLLRRVALVGPTGKTLRTVRLYRGVNFSGCDARPEWFRLSRCCGPPRDSAAAGSPAPRKVPAAYVMTP